MKKLFALGMLIVLSFMPVTVFAQEDSVQTTNQSPGNAGSSSPSSNGLGSENRDARLQNYKERFAETLTNAEERRIQAVCKGTQIVVGRLSENVAQVRQNREQAYTSISDKLQNLVTKIEAAGVNSADLSEVLTAMNAEVQIFLATMTEYQTILADLAEMDCTEDPEAFRAAIAVAKQQRTTLVSSSQGLRQYFNDSIKPVLQQLRQQLAGDTEGES